jgi:hypothetical protein
MGESCVVCDDRGCEFCPGVSQCIGCNRVTGQGEGWRHTAVRLSGESLTLCPDCAEAITTSKVVAA